MATPNYTEPAPLNTLTFVQYKSKRYRNYWAVKPTDDYVDACTQGREYAAQFVQYLLDNPSYVGRPVLGLIIKDMDFSDESKTKGYWVGFFPSWKKFSMKIPGLTLSRASLSKSIGKARRSWLPSRSSGKGMAMNKNGLNLTTNPEDVSLPTVAILEEMLDLAQNELTGLIYAATKTDGRIQYNFVGEPADKALFCLGAVERLKDYFLEEAKQTGF